MIYKCETCKNIKCWLCKGNVYYDRVMALNTCDAKPHKHDIGLFRDFVKLKGCASHTDIKFNDNVLNEITEHVDARMAGLQNLMDTPPEQRTESAQDDKLKEALFELTLIRNLIKDLTKGEE